MRNFARLVYRNMCHPSHTNHIGALKAIFRRFFLFFFLHCFLAQLADNVPEIFHHRLGRYGGLIIENRQQKQAPVGCQFMENASDKAARSFMSRLRIFVSTFFSSVMKLKMSSVLKKKKPWKKLIFFFFLYLYDKKKKTYFVCGLY